MEKKLVIDIHSHFFPKISQEQAAKVNPATTPWLQIDKDGKNGYIMIENHQFRPVYDALWDGKVRLEMMNEQGIDIQIICATPVMFCYQDPINKAIGWNQRMNDLALEMCEADNKRIKTLAQVPLQDIDESCKEVSRAKKMGHIGVQIGNHLGNKNLDDEGILTFLTHCANEDIPVFIHPWDMMAADRMPKWMLPWLVSMPAETQLGVLSLILSGAFERLPKNLKICFAHGGGSFPYLIGRVDNAWTYRDIVREDCPNLPSSYLDRVWVDSAVFDQLALHYLVDKMKSNHVMLGSDTPFPLGETPVGNLVKSSTLPDADKEQILSKTAQAFFNL